MGRHQMAASSGRARVALGALPLVATVGAIGIGSAVMSPASSDAPLEPPAGNAPGGALAPVPTVLPPGMPPAPVQVLDLAATGDPVAPRSGVPGTALGRARSGATGGGSPDGATVRRATHTPATRATTAGRAATPRPAAATVGGSGGAADHASGSGGGSGSPGGSGGSGSSGGSGNGGSSDGSGGPGGGLVGGVVGGLGSTLHSTVSGASSLLSFGDSSPSVLSFGS